MNVYEPGQRRRNKARERYMVRQNKRSSMAGNMSWRDKLPDVSLPGMNGDARARVGIIFRDFFWYLTHSVSVLLGVVVIGLVIFGLYAGSHVTSGRIFPNVWASGVYLGDMTVEEATAALNDAWNTSVQIQLVDGDRVWKAQPAQLGMQIDAQKTAEAARNVGMSGIPMGWGIKPVVSIDFNTAQNYLLDLTSDTDSPPYNAGYTWQGDQLVGLPGRDGRMLDVAQAMDTLTNDTVTIAETRRLNLAMSNIPPDNNDPKDALADAQAVAGKPFTLYGYDPFKDQSVSWSTSREVLASWLEAGPDGLTLRDDAYSAFLEAQNHSLNADGSELRYLDPIETKDRIRQAINDKKSDVHLRIRYRPTTYTVIGGDTGFRIARKTGIPFFLIQEANAGRDLGKLSIGDMVNLPTRDVTLPLDPVPDKRIVVDLDKQTLAAFENGQLKYSWLISSGLDDYPTSPGIYQVLNHEDVAAGSSFTLCNEGGGSCGQWEMNWFMGMYEVGPGLMNGFHGGVLLPNGRFLGDGGVGTPFTFGCVMSRDDQGKILYDWATDGTMVEIISSEFAPQSDLGQMVLAQDLPLQA
ncbi:MAG: L,D-transpeptidase family protein [Chloroflexota bacterium]